MNSFFASMTTKLAATLIATMIFTPASASTVLPDRPQPPSMQDELKRFPEAQVVAILKNVSNYSNGPRFPEPPGAFEQITLLANGVAVIESAFGAKKIKLADRNQISMSNVASSLRDVELTLGWDPMESIIPPNFRGVLAVNKYDWRTKTWGQEIKTVWLEAGCYSLQLHPENLYDRMQSEILVAQLQTLAYEQTKP